MVSRGGSIKPLVVIVGETASGKSAVALEIARRFDGEIINADSWTVYKEFNIGTAKPTAEEMKIVPHHLFDIRNADEGFNAALYKKLANEVIEQVLAKGKLPVLVGGTGLYVDSILYDYEFLPPGNPSERERRNSLAITELLAEAEADGVSLEGVDLRNKRRIIRALESGGGKAVRKPLRDSTLVFGLRTDKNELAKRILTRTDLMFKAGLEAEVKRLSTKYGWDVEPMKGIGYHEWRDYFLGSQTLAQTRERIIRSTMQLAKKQRTWFKRNNSIQWLDNSNNIVESLTTVLNKNK